MCCIASYRREYIMSVCTASVQVTAVGVAAPLHSKLVYEYRFGPRLENIRLFLVLSGKFSKLYLH